MTTPDILLVDLESESQTPCPLQDDFPFGFSIALGNFDGVHAAHRELISLATQMAQRLCEQGQPTQSAAFFFRAPSGDYIFPRQDGHLNTLSEKMQLFRSCGLRYVFMADFPSLRHWDAESFMSVILQKFCAARAVCCGYNFRFGKAGAGTPEMLQNFFGKHCSVLPCQMIRADESNDLAISSSTVRRLLQRGDSFMAASMLRYPYVICGTVVHGKQLGRTLGFPTANLCIPAEKLLPRCGVYASIVLFDGATYPGVSNVGKRPTVDAPGVSVNCETYLLDFCGDLYDKEIFVFLLHHLRDEMAFSDLDALKAAIAADISRTKQLLSDEKSAEFFTNIREYFKKD